MTTIKQRLTNDYMRGFRAAIMLDGPHPPAEIPTAFSKGHAQGVLLLKGVKQCAEESAVRTIHSPAMVQARENAGS